MERILREHPVLVTPRSMEDTCLKPQGVLGEPAGDMASSVPTLWPLGCGGRILSSLVEAERL